MVYNLISAQEIKLTCLLTTLCIFPLSMVPYLLDKIKVYHMNELFIFLYYLFLLIALVMGCLLDFYSKVWWFDLFVHFTSGVFTGIVAFILLQKNKLISRKYKWIGFLFMIMTTIGVAACWEYFEFICDNIFQGDAQKVMASGVTDTMTDMLIATLGGFLSSCYYLYDLMKKNK